MDLVWGLDQEQKAEILRRLDDYGRDPSLALTEDQLEQQLDSELP
jgi:putative addiction module component (TIGR02574 family)